MQINKNKKDKKNLYFSGEFWIWNNHGSVYNSSNFRQLLAYFIDSLYLHPLKPIKLLGIVKNIGGGDIQEMIRKELIQQELRFNIFELGFIRFDHSTHSLLKVPVFRSGIGSNTFSTGIRCFRDQLMVNHFD